MVEIPDYQSSQSHLHGLEQHALKGDSKVYEHSLILPHAGANDYECLRLGPGQGQGQFLERCAHPDESQHLGRFCLIGNAAEAQSLGIHPGSDPGIYRNHRVKLNLMHLVLGIISPVAAVLEQKGVERWSVHRLSGSGLQLLVSLFQIIVSHYFKKIFIFAKF